MTQNTITMFQVLSPDRFPISMDSPYETMEEATSALQTFIQRFDFQGYYSMSNRERITLEEAKNRCSIIPIKIDKEDLI